MENVESFRKFVTQIGILICSLSAIAIILWSFFSGWIFDIWNQGTYAGTYSWLSENEISMKAFYFIISAMFTGSALLLVGGVTYLIVRVLKHQIK